MGNGEEGEGGRRFFRRGDVMRREGGQETLSLRV